MSAFERIRSGTPALDKVLDSIRLGDNVVWRVSNLEEFLLFAEPYVDQAIEDNRNFIYVRFATHPPLVENKPGVKTVHIELSHRFEDFTVKIHNLIEQEGKDAFYVFDCLSELQTAWATDLMMGNFFRLTCPFLFTLDTVAWFPVIRGKHSFDAIDRIRDTTQLLLDVYAGGEDVYVRPVKVWNRFSPEMFLPHRYDMQTKALTPLRDGVDTARFYRLMNEERTEDQNMDSWERFFRTAALKEQAGMDVQEDCNRMCDIMLTRDERLRRMIKRYFRTEDYFNIRKRMIGTGMIGGKACGMLLARSILQEMKPEFQDCTEEHDSFYIGSDVFYSYIVDNGFWDLRLRQRKAEEYFSLAPQIEECLRSGSFSGDLRARFHHLLDYFGGDPVIVRSSSLLEDGFGNAFAGKYESVFCANAGTPEENLAAFEDAVRTVYASTMSRAALEYRLMHGLEKRDEQMALLVQRVSGSRYGNFFLPCAAGVGYSFSPYRMSGDIRPEDGMLRLVMGLGTAAVDRATGTYPRLVQLTRPLATPYTTTADRHRYSQRLVDVVDMEAIKWASKTPEEVVPLLPSWLTNTLLTHDNEAELFFREKGERREITFVSCDGLVGNRKLMNMMRDILRVLQEAYDSPVDIEYTINLSPKGEFAVNLLQCRPLLVAKDNCQVSVPEALPREQILLESVHAGMGLSREIAPSIAVIIDAVGYYQLGQSEKYRAARALGAINWHFRNAGETLMLFTPGRICTSSPELGVPSSFAEISAFSVVCEVAESRAGYRPELSYGSHIFQDLVEANILYAAVFEDECTKAFDLSPLEAQENLLLECDPSATGLEDIIHVVRTPGCRLWYDMTREHLLVAMGQ